MGRTMNYAKHVSTKTTPQSQKVRGKKQVKNNAGGYVFKVEDFDRLERFLILGSEGGSYYASESKLTRENAEVVLRCGEQDGRKAVETIVSISEAGRAPRNNAAIFALSLLASEGDKDCRRAALEALPRVCRTATHLFTFLSCCKELRGWGRGLRDAVAAWYNEKPVEKLAYQMTKYRNREGYTHRDALRLSHPKTDDRPRNALYKYATQKKIPRHKVFSQLRAFEELQNTVGVDEAVKIIQDNNLTLEHIPNTFLNDVKIWEALLPNLPMTAMIRNLGKMTSVGALKPLSSATNLVCERLADVGRLKRARIHPLSVLLAQTTYSKGQGVRGSLVWNPVPQVKAALEDAFYASFASVEPTNKRFLLAVDVSGSMVWAKIANTHIDCMTGAACMAMVTAKTEPKTHIMGFSHNLVDIDLSRCDSLNSVRNKISRIPMGGTDCALPMIYAKKHNLEVDTFIVYTDNETWYGKIHPFQALKQYRKHSGIDAKMIVCGMASNGFSIADPSDLGSLDIVGFDANVPRIISDFVDG